MPPDLHSYPDTNELSAAEIQDRLKSIDDDTVKLVPWSDVRIKMAGRRKC